MTQLPLGPETIQQATHRRALAIVRAIVARVSPKEVAYALDVSPSALQDALAERERKGVRMEWLPTLLLLADDGERKDLLATIAGVAGYCVERARPATPEERLLELEQRVRDTFGRAGEALLIDLNTRGRR